MKSVHKVINKNLKMLFVVAAVTAVALGGLLLLITGNQDREQVAVEAPSSTAATEEESQQEETTRAALETTEAAISQEAQNLFAAKVQDLSGVESTVSVARLLETIDLKNKVAAYTVELQTKESPNSMKISFDKIVKEENRDAFDQKMQKYAEQILALVTDLDEVQWIYTVRKNGSNTEVTVYLNGQQATDLLKHDVKSYGESAQMIQTLLNQQKGNEANGVISGN